MASPQLGLVWPRWFILFVGWVLLLRQALGRGSRAGLGPSAAAAAAATAAPAGLQLPTRTAQAAHPSAPCSRPTSLQWPFSAASGERKLLPGSQHAAFLGLPAGLDCIPPPLQAAAACLAHLPSSLPTASFAPLLAEVRQLGHLPGIPFPPACHFVFVSQNCGSSGINLVGVGVAYLTNTGCGLFYRFTWWTCW